MHEIIAVVDGIRVISLEVVIEATVEE